MNLSLVHFMSALGSSAALGPSAANLLTPKFSRNTARAHMNTKLMDTAIPIRKLQGDDILGVRGVGIVRTAAIGSVGIDTNAMANVADGVVGDGVRGVGGIAVGGSVRGVGISSLPGISSVLLPEGGGGSRNKISIAVLGVGGNDRRPQLGVVEAEGTSEEGEAFANLAGLGSDARGHDKKDTSSSTQKDDQHSLHKDKTLDFPNMGDNSTMVVVGMRKNKPPIAAALAASLHGKDQHYISTSTAIGRQLQTTDWSQRGGDIYGEAAGDNFGYSMAMSNDGSILAVGAPLNDGNGIENGSIRVYVWNGSFYVQRGSDIDGEANGDQSGSSMAMSHDGSILAVGASYNDGNGINSGSVSVFVWNGSIYAQRGSNINGQAAGDFLSSIAMSYDGSVLAVGARHDDDSGISSGSARVFVWDGSISMYLQRGSDINGKAAGDNFGWSMAMSNDGSILAVGALYNDGNGSNSGSTRVYVWDGSISMYLQRGSDINGEAAGDSFGYSIAMSYDGSILAVGAPYNDGNGSASGSTRVFVWNGSIYTQRGSDIDGQAAGDIFGSSIAMSYDGSILAVGARKDDDNGSNSGSTSVYVWNGSIYAQRGSNINGQAAGDSFGFSMALSNDGSILAVGARDNDVNGYNSGSTSVYVWPVVTTPSPSPVAATPPSSPWVINFLNITADFSVNSTEELIVDYVIGKGRTYETFLYEKDCSMNITDITINSTVFYTEKNDTHGMLAVKHSLRKSMIANSSIWNASTSEIVICQVVQLIVPVADGIPEKMVISEDTRILAIDFDLSVDFEINNTTLGEATIESGAGSADVTSYVEACKCDGAESFTCNDDALVPNSELFVCIKSKSSDVKINFVDSMNITQGDETMIVMESNNVKVPSITSIEYVPVKNGVLVSTFVPTNLFNYAVDEFITISGGMVMKLDDGSSRKLRADTTVGGAKFDENEKASFELKVGLQDEMVLEDGTAVNSATDVASASKDVGMLVVIFASAYTMMW